MLLYITACSQARTGTVETRTLLVRSRSSIAEYRTGTGISRKTLIVRRRTGTAETRITLVRSRSSIAECRTGTGEHNRIMRVLKCRIMERRTGTAASRITGSQHAGLSQRIIVHRHTLRITAVGTVIGASSEVSIGCPSDREL